MGYEEGASVQGVTAAGEIVIRRSGGCVPERPDLSIGADREGGCFWSRKPAAELVSGGGERDPGRRAGWLRGVSSSRAKFQLRTGSNPVPPATSSLLALEPLSLKRPQSGRRRLNRLNVLDFLIYRYDIYHTK